MNNKQLYQDTFSQVQFTGKIDPVMLAKKQNGRSIRRLVILAAGYKICVNLIEKKDGGTQ